MIKKTYILSFVSLLLILGITVKSTMSYFYTYTDAKGSFTVSLDDESFIEEDPPTLNIKNLKISNTGKDPIFVRVKAILPDPEVAKLSQASKDAGWTEKGQDDFYYYTKVLESGDMIEIKFDLNMPESLKAGEEYNIVLLYEATPALYNETDGWHANWDHIIPPDSEHVKEGN